VNAVLNFYAFPEAVRVVFSMLTVLSAGTAALCFVLLSYRFRQGLNHWFDNAAAFLVLCQTVINAALAAQVQHNIAGGFFVQSGYAVFRYAIFAALVAVVLLLLSIGRRLPDAVRARRVRHLKDSVVKPHIYVLWAAASFLTLPIMEVWTNRAFPISFSASLLILLVSSVWLSVMVYGELVTSISNLSVKQAMDSLSNAVLFYGKSGNILLLNSKMQELMLKTAGRVIYNGKLYLETVVAVSAEHRDTDSYLLRLSDGVWLFTVCKITLGRKTVTRIIAADVTEQDKAALLLRDIHNELELKRERLKALVESIESTCRSEELLRAKTDIHDEQNKKMIPLLQYLRYKELPDSETFDSLRTEVLRGIQKSGDDNRAGPKVMLDAIINQCSCMGVKKCLSGPLPPEREISEAFMQILLESAANAVRHGYACEVDAEITDDSRLVTLQVTDNSALPPREIIEGSGIAGMRRRTERIGGSLEIFTVPRFTLLVRVIRGMEFGE